MAILSKLEYMQQIMDLMDKNSCHELLTVDVEGNPLHIYKKPLNKVELKDKEDKPSSIFNDPDFYAAVPNFIPPKI